MRASGSSMTHSGEPSALNAWMGVTEEAQEVLETLEQVAER